MMEFHTLYSEIVVDVTKDIKQEAKKNQIT